jgi:hypothetical protein
VRKSQQFFDGLRQILVGSEAAICITFLIIFSDKRSSPSYHITGSCSIKRKETKILKKILKKGDIIKFSYRREQILKSWIEIWQMFAYRQIKHLKGQCHEIFDPRFFR